MNEKSPAKEMVQPHDIEAEQSCLGSMMLEVKALERGLELLTSADFYRPVHQLLFETMRDMAARSEPVDLITLPSELRTRGKFNDAGGAEYLASLVQSVPTAANLEHYARVVENRATLRRLINIGTAIARMGYMGGEEEVSALIERAETLVLQGLQRRSADDIKWMRDTYLELYQRLPELGSTHGIPIGLPCLARQCIGMAGGELIVVGARPRVGKSALAFDLLMHAAKCGHKAAIISCEMTDEQFALREMAKASGIHLHSIYRGGLDEIHYNRICDGIGRTWDYPVAFINAVGKPMAEIQAACRRLVAQGVEIIAIDHLQRVRPDNPKANRHVQLGQISSDAKDIALRHGIAVLGLCQLGREVDRRGPNARPQLSDLKESGDIEANADVVWLLWRPMGDEAQRSMEVTEAEIIVAKNRMLPEAVVRCGFHGRRFKFVDMAEREPAEVKG